MLVSLIFTKNGIGSMMLLLCSIMPAFLYNPTCRRGAVAVAPRGILSYASVLVHSCIVLLYLFLETTKITGEVLAPQFTTKLEAREVLAGEQVVLTCHVVGIPEPEIVWYQVSCRSRFLSLAYQNKLALSDRSLWQSKSYLS
jgi:hypothetical protein